MRKITFLLFSKRPMEKVMIGLFSCNGDCFAMKKALECTRGQFIKVQYGFKVVSDHSRQIY